MGLPEKLAMRPGERRIIQSPDGTSVVVKCVRESLHLVTEVYCGGDHAHRGNDGNCEHLRPFVRDNPDVRITWPGKPGTLL